MSSASLPRLYFNGHFSWNPSTYNNDDYAGGGLDPYDADADTPNWAWLHQQVYEGGPVTRDNFRRWSYTDVFELTEGRDAGQTLAPAEWNFFGGMECGFVTEEAPVLQQPPNPDNPGTPVFSKPSGDDTTRIRGYTTVDGAHHDDGAPVGLEPQFNLAPPSGPFAASPKLIDINPTSPLTSQVFADDFQLGDGTDGFAGRVGERMHSRYLYFQHNMNLDGAQMIAGNLSTVFQTVLPKDSIDWHGDSDALAQLRAAAGAAEGLMLRMVAYDTRYFNGPFFGEQDASQQFPSMLKIRTLYLQYFEALARFERGHSAEPPPPPCNRAFSRIVGWIGVWDSGDFTSIPGGRVLAGSTLPDQPSSAFAPAPVAPMDPRAYARPTPFGIATVERAADFSRVTVDLGSAIPEAQRDQFGAFGKVELGIGLDGTFAPLATLVADAADFQPDYLRTSGLIDLDPADFAQVGGHAVTADRFDAAQLLVQAESATWDPATSAWAPQPVVAQVETELIAQTMTRGLYVDEPPPNGSEPTTVFTVEVRERGVRPSAQVGLAIAQTDQDGTLLIGDRRQLVVSVRGVDGWLDVDNTTVVDATSGSVEVGLRGVTGEHATTGGAMPMLYFYPVANEIVAGSGLSPGQPVSGIAVAAGNPVATPAIGYAAVKLLPYDRSLVEQFDEFLGHHPPVHAVNDWVFQHVYETFHLMYPVMDFIGTPQKFQAWRGRILEVTKPEAFATSAYMPPTRSLSAGKRRILERWDKYVSGVGEPDHPLRSIPVTEHERA